MSLVKFAVICDSCLRRQEEYSGPDCECLTCGADICQKCYDSYKENNNLMLRPCCDEPDLKEDEP